MTIVGTDGKEKYVVEGETITDVAATCEMYLKDGYHLIDAQEINFHAHERTVHCVSCNQTLAAIRIKGEKVV